MGAAAEALPAVRAPVWPLSSVNPLVLDKQPAQLEALPALGTSIGPLLTVHLLVPAQGQFGAKAFPALGAWVRPLLCTQATGKAGAFPCVGELVLDQV